MKGEQTIKKKYLHKRLFWNLECMQ